MKKVEIITAREIELENLLIEAMDALIGAKGTMDLFGNNDISMDDVKEISKDQLEILSDVYNKYVKVI